MIRLGIIAVLLLVIAIGMLIFRNKFLRPAVTRRHIAQLEEENRRLDELLERTRVNQEVRR